MKTKTLLILLGISLLAIIGVTLFVVLSQQPLQDIYDNNANTWMNETGNDFDAGIRYLESLGRNGEIQKAKEIQYGSAVAGSEAYTFFSPAGLIIVCIIPLLIMIPWALDKASHSTIQK